MIETETNGLNRVSSQPRPSQPQSGRRPADAPSTAHFRGWIPTVSGRLSFTVFGHTIYPSRAITANIADHEGRYIITYQSHNAADVILPFRRILAPFFLRYDGNLFFVFIGNTHGELRQNFLNGTVCVFSDVDLWRQEVRPALQQYRDLLRSYHISISPSLRGYAQDSEEMVRRICLHHASFYANVRISRTGTTDVIVPFPNAASPRAPRFPNDSVRRSHLVHVLAAQVFFFLRNLGHHHQHHNPATDTIVDLYRIEVTDDISWRLNTLYSMYRAVIEAKRNPHSSTFNNCLGILAYASTFQNICGEEIGHEEGKKVLPIFYAANAANSIKASQAQVDREITIRLRRQDLLRNTLLAILSVVLSFAGLLQLTSLKLDVTIDPIIIASVSWALSHAMYTLTLFILLIMGMLVVSDSRQRGAPPRLIADALRIVQAFPRAVAIGIFAIVAVILYSIAVIILKL